MPETKEPTTWKSRLWSITKLAVPALITGWFSLLEARADTQKKHENAQKTTEVAYEALQHSVADLQSELKTSNERTEKLEAALVETTEQLRKVEEQQTHRPSAVHKYEAPAHHAPQFDKPERFSDVVEHAREAK